MTISSVFPRIFLQQGNTRISSILVSLNKPNHTQITEDKTVSDVPDKTPIKQDFTPHVTFGFHNSTAVCLHSTDEPDVCLRTPPPLLIFITLYFEKNILDDLLKKESKEDF